MLIPLQRVAIRFNLSILLMGPLLGPKWIQELRRDLLSYIGNQQEGKLPMWMVEKFL
ncbi:hypothetical protein D3C86_2039600 [compost metagenome]